MEIAICSRTILLSAINPKGFMTARMSDPTVKIRLLKSRFTRRLTIIGNTAFNNRAKDRKMAKKDKFISFSGSRITLVTIRELVFVKVLCFK